MKKEIKKVKKTKTGEVLKHLTRYGAITDPIAREKYHTNRLSAIICNLRKKGYHIDTVICEGRDSFGKNRYGKYILIKNPKMRRG